MSASDEIAPAEQQGALARLRALLMVRERREALLVLFGRGVTAISSFVGIRILTSVMAPESYGPYSLLIAFIALISGFLLAPIGQSMNRFVHDAAKAGTLRSLLLHAIGSTSLLSLLGGVLAFPFARIYFKEVRPTWLIAVLICATLLGNNLRDRQLGAFNTFRWRGRYVVLGIADAWARILCITVGILTLGGVMGAMVGITVASLALAIAGLPWLHEFIKQAGHAPSGATFNAKTMYRFAGPMFAVQLLSWVITTSDRYVVAAMQGDGVVGRYVAGYQVASAIPSIIVTIFFPVVAPIIYEHVARRPNEPIRLDVYLIGLAGVSTAACGLLVTDIDGVCRLLLSRREFDTGDAVIPWVAAGLILSAMQQLVEHQVYLTQKTPRLVVVHFSAAATNVVANVVLARYLGITAPAVATFLTYLLLLGISVRICRPVISLASWLRVAALIALTATIVVTARVIVPATVSVVLRASLRWTFFGAAYGLVAWLVIWPGVRGHRESVR